MVNLTQEKPVKWCSVNLSEVISRGKRLEASVFDVEAKQAHERIYQNQNGYVFLNGEKGLIERAYYPGRFKRIYCQPNSGVGFYLPSQMMDIYPRPEKFISKLTKCDLNELKLKEGTLLLTRSGTIGNVSLVSKTIKDCVFSDDVIRVTFKHSYDLGYVYAFLKSKTGNLVLTTNGYGSVITHLEPEHLSTVPIPNAPNEIKTKINDLIIRSYELRDESNDLIDEATQLLIKELHLPPIEEFEEYAYDTINAFSIKLSDMNNRADASYHVPIVNAIINHLNEHAEEVTTVGNERICSDVILPGRFKRVYVEDGYGCTLFGGKQLYELDPSGKKYLSKAKHNKRIVEQLAIHTNAILVTRSGTIGKVNLVPQHWENWVASEHIIRVIPKTTEIAGYLYVFLSSEYGKTLITRFTYGSVVDEIDDNHVRQIPIPLLKNKEIQKQINDLALLANQKRYEAYCSEQEALKIMDEEIIYSK